MEDNTFSDGSVVQLCDYVDEVECVDVLPINEEYTQQGNLNDNIESYTNKRGQEEMEKNDEEWIQVPKSRLKRRLIEDIQLTVTCKDKFPKQFALAKLLKAQNISGIMKIKYINAYKILVTFNSEDSENKFLSCDGLRSMGWRSQKTWEVGTSYGIVKDIDLDLSEEDLLQYLRSDIEIVSVKRLSRRSGNEWTPSETIRVGFKGPSLPSHIFILDLRIKVESFIFPVTQCSNCWRFGHTKTLCPSNKIICPKCSGHHENCEVTTFKCVNCGENHMALSKSCKIYKKEKRIRELMSEFNVTYRKALLMYVPPTPHRISTNDNPTGNLEIVDTNEPSTSTRPTFAEAVISGLSVKKKELPKKRAPNKITKKHAGQDLTEKVTFMEVSQNTNTEEEVVGSDSSEADEETYHEPETEERPVSFVELIQKIRRIIILKKLSIFSKIKKSLQVIVDWVMTFVSKSVSDVSDFFKSISSLFING